MHERSANPCPRYLSTPPAESMASVRSIVRRDNEINRAGKGHVREDLMEIVRASAFQKIVSVQMAQSDGSRARR